MATYYPPTSHNGTINTTFNNSDFQTQSGGTLTQTKADARYLQLIGGVAKNLTAVNGIATQFTTGYNDGQIGFIISNSTATTSSISSANTDTTIISINLASKGVYVITGQCTFASVPFGSTFSLSLSSLAAFNLNCQAVNTNTSSATPYSYSVPITYIYTNTTGTQAINLIGKSTTASISLQNISLNAVRIA
jgi:hypothetical protein